MLRRQQATAVIAARAKIVEGAVGMVEMALSRLEEKDPLLAEEIRKLMFVFEDIAKIDDRGIQILLKEVPNDKLLLALKTAHEDIRTKIFKQNNSSFRNN